MYIIEAKNIRDVLDFRIKSLRAIGQEDIAAMIYDDLQKIMQNEKFISCEYNESIFADKVNSVKAKL